MKCQICKRPVKENTEGNHRYCQGHSPFEVERYNARKGNAIGAKKIYYPNCSELIADFNIHDPKVFYPLIKDLGERYEWQFDPSLSLRLLQGMVAHAGNEDSRMSVMVLDLKGRQTSLNYGSNGYDNELGFWLADSGNNDYDSSQYPFFAAAVDECEAEMRTYDGGHSDGFDKWYENNDLPRLIKKVKCRRKPRSTK